MVASFFTHNLFDSSSNAHKTQYTQKEKANELHRVTINYNINLQASCIEQFHFAVNSLFIV